MAIQKLKISDAAKAKKKNDKITTPAATQTAGAVHKLAIIRIRGTDDVNSRIESTMRMLKLHKKHTCSVFDENESMLGMAERCKDYVTYGEIDDETYRLLVEKRGKKDAEGKLQNWFHLSPPRGGFERRGIKYAFTQKGALGYRAEKINILLKKMI